MRKTNYRTERKRRIISRERIKKNKQTAVGVKEKRTTPKR